MSGISRLRRRRLKLADAEDFTGIERLDLGFADGDDGHGFTGGGEEYQRVARFLIGATGMALDECGDSAAAEAVFGQVGRECDADVEFVFHR